MLWIVDSIRIALPLLDNNDDVVMLLACRWFKSNMSYDSACPSQEKRFSLHTYRQLAINSTFSLVVEGFGYHSFRLNEVMGAGSIPVIVVDNYILVCFQPVFETPLTLHTKPFEGFLDWENFSIRVPEYKLFMVSCCDT